MLWFIDHYDKYDKYYYYSFPIILIVHGIKEWDSKVCENKMVYLSTLHRSLPSLCVRHCMCLSTYLSRWFLYFKVNLLWKVTYKKSHFFVCTINLNILQKVFNAGTLFELDDIYTRKVSGFNNVKGKLLTYRVAHMTVISANFNSTLTRNKKSK